jgi:hypothetical protein
MEAAESVLEGWSPSDISWRRASLTPGKTGVAYAKSAVSSTSAKVAECSVAPLQPRRLVPGIVI